MEHDEIYTLMMEALDSELDEPELIELDAHLHSCSSCNHEWQALQAIHQLFLQTPALSPAADFTQRTLSLRPNSSYRIWTLTAVYGLLLISGLLPLAVIAWLTAQLGPALNEPAFVRSVSQAGGQVLRLGEAVLAAFGQGLISLGELAGQQPAIAGWLLVMIGAILLWTGVYSQLTNPYGVLRPNGNESQ